jgi:hypothetical protein
MRIMDIFRIVSNGHDGDHHDHGQAEVLSTERRMNLRRALGVVGALCSPPLVWSG